MESKHIQKLVVRRFLFLNTARRKRALRKTAFGFSVPARIERQAKPARSPFRRCGSRSPRPWIAVLSLLLAQGLSIGASTALAQSTSIDMDSEQAAGVSVATAERSGPGIVNINTASAAELASGLSGVGANRAEAIVRYREQFGPFESIEELSEVSGIGASTVERNRLSIRIE